MEWHSETSSTAVDGPTAQALSARPVPAQRRRGEARPVPVLRDEYAHLSVESLRDYRRALTAEEDKVSYWRRLLQGRLDVVAGSTAAAALHSTRLGTMLTSDRVTSGRQHLATVVPTDDIPPLPALAELWDRQVADDDDDAREALLADLRTAEDQLSVYRTALHARISEATGELIARYRVDPTLCLSVLPLPSARAGA